MICQACANQQSLLNWKPTGRAYQYYLFVHCCRLTSFIQTIDPLVTGIIAKPHNRIQHQGKQTTVKGSYETERSGGAGQVYRGSRQPLSVQTHGYSVEVDRLWWQVLLGRFLFVNGYSGQPPPTHPSFLSVLFSIKIFTITVFSL